MFNSFNPLNFLAFFVYFETRKTNSFKNCITFDSFFNLFKRRSLCKIFYSRMRFNKLILSFFHKVFNVFLPSVFFEIHMLIYASVIKKLTLLVGRKYLIFSSMSSNIFKFLLRLRKNK